FDYTNAPLSGDALFKISADEYLYYQRNHHLIADGASGRIFTDRLAEIYSALVAGTPYRESYFASLEDCVAEDEAYRRSPEFERDRDYWRGRLSALPAPVSLPPATAPASARPVRRTTYLD